MGLHGNFFFIVLGVALLGLVSASTSLVISAGSANVNMAIQLSPILFVPQILFSGIFIQTSAIPVFLRWAQYLCSLKYAVNLISIVEFKHHHPAGYGPAVDHFLGTQDVYDAEIASYCGILAAVFVGFRSTACFILAWKGRQNS
mmetsp:Transcript_54955/g.129860  ORF Transcript_54955/g.129860 Transcript_54955/m.129860 type:complete len:144 (-) Transcript_54955:21-452(-)